MKSVENKWLNCTNLGVMEGGGAGPGGGGEQVKVVCTVHSMCTPYIMDSPPHD